MPPGVVWFRRDLRLTDNPALAAAVAAGQPILPVFLPDEEERGDWPTGAASRIWLHRSLRALNQSLNNKLLLLRGNAEQALPALMRQSQAGALYFNRRYEPEQRRREQQVTKALAPLPAYAFDAATLIPPQQIKTKSGTPYQVFTPFYRQGYLAETAPKPAPPLPAARTLPLVSRRPSLSPSGLTVDTLPAPPAWGRKVLAHWQPGEAAAQQALADFLTKETAYAARRDYPAQAAVSRLSPHLHFGEISARQIRLASGTQDSTFLRQLVWRDFSTYLLYHFPELPARNWKRDYDAFPWRDDEALLQRWRQGLTGIPIVDAGMRELWTSGYMHNRVRMIVASFLTKNLLLSWQHGARWFWDCLVDADLANNSAGWQWVAGCGADAAPYFRIFNPLLQSEKFDAPGDYIAQHIPELRALPPAGRHRPWRAGGVANYPPPLVELVTSRRQALAAYQTMKAAL